ncbi:CatB-related O-acetyltransferase [Mesonia sp. HuA40]|nr:CatB-related O-acetyltransferase [Mesonia sp. HuA40]
MRGQISLGIDNYINGVSANGNIKTGPNCRFFKCTLTGNIEIGRYTSLWGPNLDLTVGRSQILIGNFCSIARNVSIQTYNHNFKKITSYYIGQNLFKEKWKNEQVYKTKPLVIKNDVWIGAHCVILGGLTIGNGAIIAANSVVTKDVPPYSIVAGSPGKVIGYRFEEETIIKLENLKWWDWSINKIKLNKFIFENELNTELLDKIK